jgi:hypothetical protein
VKYWNGTTMATVASSWTGGSAQLDSARIVLFHRNRLLCLGTKEAGTVYSKRWRATGVDPNLASSAIWQSGKLYGDAPTDESIVWAAIVQDEVFVGFERSLWLLEWRDDYREPFRWRPVSPIDGAASRHAGVALPFPTVAYIFGRESLFTIGGEGIGRADAKIPDYAAANAGTYRGRIASGISRRTHEALWCHTTSGGDPDTCLAWNYESQTWSVYKLPFDRFGTWEVTGSLTVDEIDELVDDVDWTPDQPWQQSGYAQLVAADGDLRIWEAFVGTGDGHSGDPIKAIFETASLSPFRGSERTGVALVRCGMLELLGTTGRTVTVKAYRDWEDTPWLTTTATFEGSGAVGRCRITVNADAALHRFVVEEESANPFYLDAIIPWFEDAGTVEWEL